MFLPFNKASRLHSTSCRQPNMDLPLGQENNSALLDEEQVFLFWPHEIWKVESVGLPAGGGGSMLAMFSLRWDNGGVVGPCVCEVHVWSVHIDLLENICRFSDFLLTDSSSREVKWKSKCCWTAVSTLKKPQSQSWFFLGHKKKKCLTKNGRQNLIAFFCGCCMFDSVRRKQGSCPASRTEITAWVCGIQSLCSANHKQLKRTSSFRQQRVKRSIFTLSRAGFPDCIRAL